jgi:hypothetical protein
VPDYELAASAEWIQIGTELSSAESVNGGDATELAAEVSVAPSADARAIESVFADWEGLAPTRTVGRGREGRWANEAAALEDAVSPAWALAGLLALLHQDARNRKQRVPMKGIRS